MKTVIITKFIDENRFPLLKGKQKSAKRLENLILYNIGEDIYIIEASQDGQNALELTVPKIREKFGVDCRIIAHSKDIVEADKNIAVHYNPNVNMISYTSISAKARGFFSREITDTTSLAAWIDAWFVIENYLWETDNDNRIDCEKLCNKINNNEIRTIIRKRHEDRHLVKNWKSINVFAIK